jgi:uncharacterized RDD family membrane protein YckC
MTDASTPNPFAPPRAHVEDQTSAPQEVVTATRMSRFLAFLVDASPGIVLGILAVLMVPGILTGSFDPNGGGMAAFGLAMLVFGLVCLGWLVWTIVLLYRYGQTVGKKVLGIRVVRMDGSRVSFARFFFLRWLGMAVLGGILGGICGALHIRYVGNMIGLVDALFIFGAAHRCLHDYIADTQVVTAESSLHATLEGARGR